MEIIVETFLNEDEPSSATFRVRPVLGQAFPIKMRVQCSKAMRHAYPLGTKFKLQVSVKQRKQGGIFLSEIGKDAWEVVS